MTKRLAMFLVLMTAAGCGGAGQIASQPKPQAPVAETFTIAELNGQLQAIKTRPGVTPPPVVERLPQSARFTDPIAVMPNYPIPDPRRWPEKIVNGTRFHYMPVNPK